VEFIAGSGVEPTEALSTEVAIRLTQNAVMAAVAFEDTMASLDIPEEECSHPARRLYSWTAFDGRICVCCCECGEVLKGAES
jgi:hypothetical protein